MQVTEYKRRGNLIPCDSERSHGIIYRHPEDIKQYRGSILRNRREQSKNVLSSATKHSDCIGGDLSIQFPSIESGGIVHATLHVLGKQRGVYCRGLDSVVRVHEGVCETYEPGVLLCVVEVFRAGGRSCRGSGTSGRRRRAYCRH
jgi:hypothetical protein